MQCAEDLRERAIMHEKRYRITLLFNANKVYDRQVVEGVGEYLHDGKLLSHVIDAIVFSTATVHA